MDDVSSHHIPEAEPVARTAEAGFDLDDIATGDAITVSLEKPNGDYVIGSDGQPVRFQICSVDDPRYRKTYRRIIDEKTQGFNGRKARRLSAAELERESARLVAATVVGWSNNFTWGGKLFPYSEANAVKLMSETRLRWIHDWVDAIANDRERFFGKPSTT